MKDKVIYVYIVSLGCSKNLVDTELMAGSLLENQIGITANLEEASVFFINTCAFIPPAREEAVSHIKGAIDWKSEDPENRKIIVGGCLTQWDKKLEYVHKYSTVDLWLGTDFWTELPEKILALFSKTKTKKIFTDASSKSLYNHQTPRLQLTPSHYAYIKIAEGCNNHCSYCSIPMIRGKLRSRDIKSIVVEAKNLLKNNVKELIIIAQDITAFSKEKSNPKEDLTRLLKELDSLDGHYWIRLHYLHPEGITDELVSVIANSSHIIPYLDIPLQHISDDILRAMNRRVTSKEILGILDRLRSSIKNLVIRTTFLVGFPGETEKQFGLLKEFVEQFKFERLGVFPFFPEPNTMASKFPNQVSVSVANKRAEIIKSIHAKNSYNFSKSLVDSELEVIFDSKQDSYYIGRTYMDSPDIDNIVKVHHSENIKLGKFSTVKITGFSEFELAGKLVKKKE